ncbi:FecCD family ABC transporter permease [Limnoglobus roseus]|uniref:Iron ABC transporter permease n=1 Tax=Limnoglobus roseus TaxID=2598579 RepID=A0A5C1A8A9_9BACT|nr:iron ABC transporter permease [Limnoglobus roseus]QEL13398.1 iron ABC transporter permease [Limnoglobus roseus]
MTAPGKTRRLFLLAAILAAAVVGSLAVGAVWLRPTEVFTAVASPSESTNPAARTIVNELRLPRALLAACIGAGLATAGTAYQGLFRNPLAEPFVIGVASGAALGATAVILSGWQTLVFGFLSPIPVGAFVGAMGAAFLTYSFAAAVRSESVAGLMLTGVAVSTLLNAAVWLLMAWNDQELARTVNWLMGSLAGRGWPDLRQTAPWIAVGTAGVWALARPLDALAEGEEVARSLGLRVRLVIGLVLAAASLAAAAAVAAAGIIGFVGLIAPHIARRLVGESHAALIPASGLLGGILLVLADALARTLTAPTELPVGIVTAALGGPFFLYLLQRRRV